MGDVHKLLGALCSLLLLRDEREMITCFTWAWAAAHHSSYLALKNQTGFRRKGGGRMRYVHSGA